MTKPERTQALRALIDTQANDDGLWFQAQSVSEAYVQQELRKLHTACEACLEERTHLLAMMADMRDKANRLKVHGNPMKWCEADGIELVVKNLEALLTL